MANGGNRIWLASYAGIIPAKIEIHGDTTLIVTKKRIFASWPDSWIFKGKQAAARKAIKLVSANLRDAEKNVITHREQIAELERIANG